MYFCLLFVVAILYIIIAYVTIKSGPEYSNKVIFKPSSFLLVNMTNDQLEPIAKSVWGKFYFRLHVFLFK